MTIKAISLALVAAVTAGAAATPTFARDYGYDRAYAYDQGYDRSYHDSCPSQGGAAIQQAVKEGTLVLVIPVEKRPGIAESIPEAGAKER